MATRSGARQTRHRGNLGRISVVQDDAQQRAVDFEWLIVVVLDEAELLEFVQKEIHPRARRADHFGERFL